MDTNSTEFKAALRDHAKSLGVDPDAEPHLLGLVEEALLADIPEGWEQGETEDGTLYYFNTETEESIWEHPLDAHYRGLIKTKKSEHVESSSITTATIAAAGTATTPDAQTATTPISSVEVYSFDEDSDDDAAPVVKTGAAKESEKSSRVASLFPQPVPSFSSTAAAMAANKREFDSSVTTTSVSSSSLAAAAPGGFGRDRSWLLDADDDDSNVAIPTLGNSSSASARSATINATTTTGATAAAATPISTLQSNRSNGYGGRDEDVFSSSRPSFASSLVTSSHVTSASSATPSSLSFSTRMYGSSGASGATTLPSGLSNSGDATLLTSSSGSSSVTMLMDIGGSATTAGGSASTSPTQSKAASPRRGLGSSIKNQFFNDMSAGAASTAPTQSSVLGSSSGAVSLPADVAKIQQLEKRVSELSKQNEQLTSELQKTRQQLEQAQLEAKESNYLKMKVSESKTKLADKDTELARVTQEHAAALAKLQLELEQIKREREQLATRQQQQASSSSHEVLEWQKSAATALADKAALQRELGELEQRLRATQQDAAKQKGNSEEIAGRLAALSSTLEHERSSHASEISALRASLEQCHKDHDAKLQQCRKDHDTESQQLRAQLDAVKREAIEKERRSESAGVLQDTLERQSKFLKEVEERNKELQSRVATAEEKETAAQREAKQREQDCADVSKKTNAARAELEAKETQLQALSEKLRNQIEQMAALEARSAAWLRQESDWKRERAGVERECRELANELKDKSEELQRLQAQLRKQSDEHLSAVSKLQMELQDAQNQLKTVKLQELLPLEKQCEQLRRELERTSERVETQDKERRQNKHEIADAVNQIHQLQIEIEAWKRKEQQQRAQREMVAHEKSALEKHAATVEAEQSNYKTAKRLELEKLTFRMRELESLVAQKDYEILRIEERFTKAEAWRLKEARRVEERDTQLLDVKEELAQLKSRNVDAENNVVIQELRREREQLQHRVAQVTQQLEDEKLARQVSGQKFQDELEMLQKGIEWQLPQLAAACVSRSSEEWGRKCHAVVKALRDDFHMKALSERNELLRKVQNAEDAREHIEQKLKNALAECDFLRKEVHRVEDNNKVLLDQLHTVRVYLTQRSMAPSMIPGAFPSVPPWVTHPHASNNNNNNSNNNSGVHAGGHPPPPSAMFSGGGVVPPSPPPPAAFGVPFTDFSTVNHLNTQLGILHTQFQQLFDATERRPPGISIAKPPHRQPQFSPSDRFEIPSSPIAGATTKQQYAQCATKSATSTRASDLSVDLDQTMDVLLDQTLESCGSATSAVNRSKEREKEQLISTLESLALATASTSPVSASNATSSAVSLVADAEPLVGTSDSSSWYQKDYWRNKYQ